jgi:hypothetical protein
LGVFLAFGFSNGTGKGLSGTVLLTTAIGSEGLLLFCIGIIHSLQVNKFYALAERFISHFKPLLIMQRKSGGRPGEGKPHKPTKRVKKPTRAILAREKFERYENLVDALAERMAKSLARKMKRSEPEVAREVKLKMTRYRRLLLEADETGLGRAAGFFKSIEPARALLVKAFGESALNEFDATRIAQKIALNLNLISPERLRLSLKDMKEEEKLFLYHTKQYILATFEVIKGRSGPSNAFIQKEKLSNMPFFSFSRFKPIVHGEIQKIFGKYNIDAIHMESVPELERPIRVFADEATKKLRRRAVAGWISGLRMPRGEKRAETFKTFNDYFDAIHKVHFVKAGRVEIEKGLLKLKKLEKGIEKAGFTKTRRDFFLKRILPELFTVNTLERNSGAYLKSGVLDKEMALRPQFDKLHKQLLADSGQALIFVLKGKKPPFPLETRLKELNVNVSDLAKAAKRLKLIKATEVKELFKLESFLEGVYNSHVAAESLKKAKVKGLPDDRASINRRISYFVREVGKTANPKIGVEGLEKLKPRLKDLGFTVRGIKGLMRGVVISVQSALAIKENLAYYRHVGNIDVEAGNLDEQFKHLHGRIEQTIEKYVKEKYPFGLLEEETKKEMERYKLDAEKIDAHLAKVGVI